MLGLVLACVCVRIVLPVTAQSRDASEHNIQNAGYSVLGHRYGMPTDLVTRDTHVAFCDMNDTAGCTVRAVHDVCSGSECVSCSSNPSQWLEMSNVFSFTTLYVRKECNPYSNFGTVYWTSPSPILVGVTVDGGDDGNRSTLRGPCPLLRVGAQSIVQNLNIYCTNHKDSPRAAINIRGSDVTIQNVFVEGAPVFSASELSLTNIDGLRTRGIESSTRTGGSIANVVGSANVECYHGEYLVIQPLHPFNLVSSDGCVVIDIGRLLGIYGSQYEVEFYNRYGGSDGLNGTYTNFILIEAAILLWSLVFVLIEHQDIFYLRSVKASIGA